MFRYTQTMKLTRLIVLVLTAIIAIQSASFAQTISSQNLRQLKIDELSDADIREYYDRVVNSGLTEDQFYRLAIERGLPETELQKLKIRIAGLDLDNRRPANQKNNEPLPQAPVSTIEREVNEDAMKVPMKKTVRDSTVFGSELFSESSMVFEPNLRIPTPTNYILGPDDQLTINVFGYSEQQYNLSVNAEGNIYIPNVGPLKVSGLTIEAAAEKIRNKLASTIYRAIRTGQTRVEVSLGKIRSIRVTVIGQATKPGTYTVSSLTTLFNLLYLCGGPNETGTYREIELIRGNTRIRQVDLYDFLLRGNLEDNVMLQEQDVVRIPYYSARVIIDGAVKRPGKYEMKASENFDDLLGFSGGFADSAYRSAVQVTRISDSGIIISDIPAGDFASFNPKTGDAFHINKGLSRFSNRVILEGAVFRPGQYELKPGMTLADLLETAGGVREDAFPERGIITRLNNDLTISTTAFVLRDVLQGSQTVPLKREDVINIPSILDLRDARTVNIEGAVRAPGTYYFSENLTLKDLVLKAGGFTETANPKTVEVSRRIRNPDIRKANFIQTELINIDLSKGLAYENGETILKPFDIVTVRSEPGFNNPRVVYLQGQVMNQGRYVLEAAGERLSDLLKRAGGFKGLADSSSITIRRFVNTSLSAEERQSIAQRMLNIDRDSLENNPRLRETLLKNVELLGINMARVKANPGGTEDLILENGDMISVARASNLVRVNGEVYNPTLLPYEDNTKARFYIKKAGNFTDNARKNGVFVIYPDGRAASVKKFLFFKSYPAVTPRTEIFVPAKEKDLRKGFGTGEWIAVSSIIASIATMIIAVVNASN